MKIHLIIHESFEGPGAITNWAKSNSHQISYTRLYKGDSLPNRTDIFDFLIILGGPQSPDTQDCPYFDPDKEKKLIKQAIKDNKLVLGICLGAQLIGDALGANFTRSPKKEIGVFDLELTEAGKNHKIFSDFPTIFPVGHWHGDMPGLTSDAIVLAKSKGCPRQIIQYTEKVFGFQCHFEFTIKCIERLIKHCKHELDKNQTYIQDANQLISNNYENMNFLLFKFLNRLIKLSK